ncbi:MAG: chaperone NapD [Ignavibacteriae bacterium]|nr:chaperone NapD [Ignavibacteriota bacterium]MCB9215753.1 chaperone NapD [Ignavibacteria bacterium]
MPIMSYLVYPVEGGRGELMQSLELIDGCTVHTAKEHDLLVLVTDTEGVREEEDMQRALHEMESVAFLAMVAGYDDPEHQPEVSAR